MSTPDIMVDIETMGTGSDAPILSIGAIRFNRKTGELGQKFYRRVTLKSNVGRPIDPATVEWWMGQSKAAQESLFVKPRVSLKEALANFQSYIQAQPTQGLWSNGPTFDEVILRDATDDYSIQFQAKYWTSRCMRTIKDLGEILGVERPRAALAHDALSDAEAQADYIIAVYAKILVPSLRT